MVLELAIICIILNLLILIVRINKGRWITATLDARKLTKLYRNLYSTIDNFYDSFDISNNNAPRNMQVDIRELEFPILKCVQSTLEELTKIGHPDVIHNRIYALRPRESVKWYHIVTVIELIHLLLSSVLLYFIPIRCLLLFLIAILIHNTNTSTWTHIIKTVSFIAVYVAMIIYS